MVSFKIHACGGRYFGGVSRSINNLQWVRVSEGEYPSVVRTPVHAAESCLLIDGGFAVVDEPYGVEVVGVQDRGAVVWVSDRESAAMRPMSSPCRIDMFRVFFFGFR
jgi:hypothetical protein